MHWKLLNRISVSMHPSPHRKRASKLISNKRKPEKTRNLPLGFSKFQPFT
jgi:hypothetical protein